MLDPRLRLRLPSATPGAGPDTASGGGTTVRVGGVNQTAYLRAQSLTLRLGSFDFALVNPLTVPVVGDMVYLLEPAWDGQVVSVGHADVPRGTDKIYTIVATNSKLAYASPAPFSLSDVADNVTTFSYRGLTITKTADQSGAHQRGMATVYQQGLWPAMTFTLTSANFGLSAMQFTVVNVTVTWPIKNTVPVFAIEFGDAMVTLSAWAAHNPIADGVITSTMITDGAVTTPKLNANAVIANVINAGGTVAIDSTGVSITNGKLTFLDKYGSTALDGNGFGGSWRRFIMSGVYNGDFFAQPPTPANNIDNSTNILPSWTWTVVSGSSVTAQNVANAAAASGRSMTWSIATGAANDEAYIEQIIPVNGSQRRAATYYPFAMVQIPSQLNGFTVTFFRQYLKADAVTTTGPSTGETVAWSTIVSAREITISGGGHVAPADAYFLRLRFGVARGSAATNNTGTITLNEVRLASGNTDLILTDSTDPTVSNWADIYQSSGQLVLEPRFESGGGGKIGLGVGNTLLRYGSTVFPASPATDDLFYRTDLGGWFYWNGTRWLSERTFRVSTDFFQAQAATFTVDIGIPELLGGTDLWLVSNVTRFYVQGGTALGAAHKWVGVLTRYPSATGLETDTINSGASDTWRGLATVMGLLTGNTDQVLQWVWTKTGTPGTLYVQSHTSYRLVAT